MNLKKYITIDVIVLLGLTAASVFATIYYFNSGLHLAYNDATSHLNISRRIVDNLTPGLVQIGSVWLPLLHLLELIFVWDDYLWQSGLAGSFVSMSCFIGSGYLLYKSIELYTRDKTASAIAIVAYISNANIMYLQTTAMFEPLLILTLSGCVYFLLKWEKNNTLAALELSAVFMFLAVLTRYDGWFLMIAAISVVFLMMSMRKSFKRVESYTILYAAPALFGLFLWLVYNHMIFGNALYFAFNEYSARAQQLELASKNLLPAQGNLVLATLTFSESVILNNGLIYTLLLIMGLVVFLIDLYRRKVSIIPLLFITPYIFNVIALTSGHSVIWIPNLPPNVESFFNVRYGILVIGATIFFVGYLLSKQIILKIIIVPLIIIQIMLFYSLFPGRTEHLSFVTLRDTVASINTTTQSATDWLRSNYRGGLILISSASAESFIFNTGIKLRNFITEGNGEYWTTSLSDPGKYASYVIYFPSHTDRVGKKIYNSKQFHKDFEIVHRNQTYMIFERKDRNKLSKVELEKIRNENIVPFSYERDTDYTRFNDVTPEDYQIINNGLISNFFIPSIN